MKNLRLSPGKPRQGKNLKVNAGIALDPDTIAELDLIARSNGMSRSELVGHLFDIYLEKDCRYSFYELIEMKAGSNCGQK